MRVLIVDGNNLIARGTHVLPNAVSPDGRPVGGLYIALKMVRTFLATEPHDAVMVAMDAGSPAFRRELCPEYKAQREASRTEEEEKIHRAYVEQVSMCHELFKPFGMVTARAKGWEGDDVVAALSLVTLADHECTIFSSDRDFTQLVSERVSLWDVGKDRWIDPDPFFCLKRCLDPKAADNLDGVPGIGPAKADKLVGAWAADPARTSSGPGAFVTWCTERAKVLDPVGKLAAKVVEAQQKVRANWKCTNLTLSASACVDELKFRRTVPDKQVARDALKALGLKPFTEDFGALWPPFAGLECPV